MMFIFSVKKSELKSFSSAPFGLIHPDVSGPASWVLKDQGPMECYSVAPAMPDSTGQAENCENALACKMHAF